MANSDRAAAHFEVSNTINERIFLSFAIFLVRGHPTNFKAVVYIPSLDNVYTCHVEYTTVPPLYFARFLFFAPLLILPKMPICHTEISIAFKNTKIHTFLDSQHHFPSHFSSRRGHTKFVSVVVVGK